MSQIIFGSHYEEEIPISPTKQVQSTSPSRSLSPLDQEPPSPRSSPNSSLSLRFSQPPSPNVQEEVCPTYSMTHPSESPEVSTILPSKPHVSQVKSPREQEQEQEQEQPPSHPGPSNFAKALVVTSLKLKRKRGRKKDKDFQRIGP